MSGVAKRRLATPAHAHAHARSGSGSTRRRSKIHIVVCLFAAAYLSIWFYIEGMIIIDQQSDERNGVSSARVPLAPAADAYLNNFPLYLRDTNSDGKSNSGNSGNDEKSGSTKHTGGGSTFGNGFHSSVHCAGETHNETTAWKHRSCSYVHLCLDFSSSASSSSSAPEFFVVSSPLEREFSGRFGVGGGGGSGGDRNGGNDPLWLYSSTELERSVALGAIDPSWERLPQHNGRLPYGYGFDTIRWAPRVYDAMPSRRYYELDPDVVLVPFHAMAADNVGHLVWDNFLPIYNLLRIFGFERNNNNNNDSNDSNSNKGFRHFLIRIDTMPPLFATCDLRPKKKEACRKSFQKFLPLLGVDPDTFSTVSELRLTKSQTSPSSGGGGSRSSSKRGGDDGSAHTHTHTYPVCAKHAVAGMGWLSDHGIRGSHGWKANREKHSLDVALARNLGRGPELYAFRNFVLRNMGLEPFPTTASQSGNGNRNNGADNAKPIAFRIVLSAHSSTYADRSFGLEEQRRALVEAFPNTRVSSVTLAELPLKEQLELLSQPSQPNERIIFVSATGGGTMTAYFLPRGSSMILYYNERGGRDYFANNKNTGGQSLLDWDLMNNLGYVRTHWLPIGSMNEPEGLDALVLLVRHEMDVAMNGM